MHLNPKKNSKPIMFNLSYRPLDVKYFCPVYSFCNKL